MKVETLSAIDKPASSRFVTLAKFLIVGFTGIGVNELVYVGLVQNLGIWFVAAAIISTEASTTWNFAGNELWAFSGRKFAGPMWVRYLAYAAVNNLLLVLRVPALFILGDMMHMTPAVSNLVALGILFAVRFAISDGFVWRTKGVNPYSSEIDGARGRAAFRYDIAGLIRLDSDSELPELAYFRTAAITPPDIHIKIRRVGALPGSRVRLRRNDNVVTYREHLGVLGADFNLKLGTPIEIEASPLLALSRHVLYTNVVEALLRFVLVSKGYVLLHSAGMEVNGRATLLSAQTDTGKTSTVINLIRHRHWGFISDDMAIIDPAGRVRTFPKPMTLSYHTMVRAIDQENMNLKQRMQLQVQSRVHSKSGRSVGKGLGSLNVPIMSINSVLQLMVPPPKFHITALMPARITEEAPIDNVFLMERGEPIEEKVALDEAVNQLIENTDDAYGFPPFATLAPTLVIDGSDYMELRARERRILTEALRNVQVWRLRVRGHEWGELLPRLILGEDAAEQAATPAREPVGIPIEPDQRIGIPIEADANAPATAAAAAEEFLAAGLAQSAAGVSAEMLSETRAEKIESDELSSEAGGAESKLPFVGSRTGAIVPGAAMALAASRLPTMFGYVTGRSSDLPAGRARTRRYWPAPSEPGATGVGSATGATGTGGANDGAALDSQSEPGSDADDARPPGIGGVALGPVSSTGSGLLADVGAAKAAQTTSAGARLQPAVSGSGEYPLPGAGYVMDLDGARTGPLVAWRERAGIWLALAAILVVGAVVRLWALTAVGLNNDEAVYMGQGASLAGNATYQPLFAIFRAHPLLVQFVNSIPFRIVGVNDVTPRLISVAFGLLGVVATYATGSILYGRRVGIVAALILAVMPYDVIVSRQALLDGPETTLYVISIYQLARFIRSGQARWLYSAAFSAGLTVLAKETAILIVPVAVVFLLLMPEIRVRFTHQLVALVIFVLAFAPYPAAIVIGKGTGAAGSFISWQLLRQPNHTWTFYGDVLPGAMGPLVFAIGLIGLLYVIKRGLWEDRLVTVWIAIPAAFFELWPVKGFQYLMPIAPAVAILVGLFFDRLLARITNSDRVDAWDAAAAMTEEQRKPRRLRLPRAPRLGGFAGGSAARHSRRLALAATSLLLVGTVLTSAVPSVQAVAANSMSGSLAGTGGLPGGREMGLWVRENVPYGATFLTEGPTLANIIEFYGQRRAYGLSVSPNPIRRNPAYDPIYNPDRALQLNQIQYIATDIWSSQRSAFFNTLLRRYVSRYHGALVYRQYANASDATGRSSYQVVIEIYEVRP